MTTPMANREIFGQDPDGKSVYRVGLEGGGLTASILTWGAIVQDLRMEDVPFPLVLGFSEFDNYLHHSPYFGATAGRFANRIAKGQVSINGKRHQLDTNFLDKHTLHGGSKGIGKRNWSITDLGTSHVDLELTDHDGEMGFPGTCTITASISLKEPGILHIVYVTRSDADTIAGLAHHSYFNLGGGETILDHALQIHADHYLPVTDELIPTGEVASVGGTPFDFRGIKRIDQDLSQGLIYDHNFCLADKRRNLQQVAHVSCPASRISMSVATTEPGLQFYAGHKVSTPVPGLTGVPYGAHSGFCLEAQNWPDAPNQDGFPSALLKKGEEFRQVTQYCFSQSS